MRSLGHKKVLVPFFAIPTLSIIYVEHKKIPRSSWFAYGKYRFDETLYLNTYEQNSRLTYTAFEWTIFSFWTYGNIEIIKTICIWIAVCGNSIYSNLKSFPGETAMFVHHKILHIYTIQCILHIHMEQIAPTFNLLCWWSLFISLFQHLFIHFWKIRTIAKNGVRLLSARNFLWIFRIAIISCHGGSMKCTISEWNYGIFTSAYRFFAIKVFLMFHLVIYYTFNHFHKFRIRE